MKSFMPTLLVLLAAFACGCAFVGSFYSADGPAVRWMLGVGLIMALLMVFSNWWMGNGVFVRNAVAHYRKSRADNDADIARIRAEVLLRRHAEANGQHYVSPVPAGCSVQLVRPNEA